MTRGNKELLFKDLCMRLPYGVKVNITSRESKNRIVYLTEDNICHLTSGWWSECKPYLFPLSSMTEEQKKEYDKIIYRSIELHNREYSDIVEIDLFDNLQEFYHKNHFDYRGLIPIGLAIDATNKNVY